MRSHLQKVDGSQWLMCWGAMRARPEVAPAAGKASGPRKGMQLGKAKKANDFLDSLRAEGEIIQARLPLSDRKTTVPSVAAGTSVPAPCHTEQQRATPNVSVVTAAGAARVGLQRGMRRAKLGCFLNCSDGC